MNRQDIIVGPQATIGAPYINASVASAVELTLPDGTELIEVQAEGDSVYLRYGVNGVVTPCTAANSQEHVLADSVRHYTILKDTRKISIIGGSAATSVHIYYKTA